MRGEKKAHNEKTPAKRRALNLFGCLQLNRAGNLARAQAARASAGCPEILEVEDFYDAVHAAADRAERGDVVLLSPASAAFDKFKNFMVRGAEFKKTVMEL